ncbi:MAG: hypothetical protein JSR98_15680, partial [Proteobacteria bacterium]|nr:hypothetical protein [Pseudomonadota bacterium]
ALWSLITHPGGQEAGLGLVILLTAVVIGGIPTAGGLVLLMVGVGRARRGRKPPPAPTTFD